MPPAEEKNRTMIALVRAVAPVGTFPVKPIIWDMRRRRRWFSPLNPCDINAAKVHVSFEGLHALGYVHLGLCLEWSR